MINQKKSQVLVYGLFFGFFLAIALYYTASFLGAFLGEMPETYLGKPSLDLLKTVSESEKTLFYIDMSAKYAAQSAVIDLAENGGFYLEPDCGKYLGYSLLNNESKQITECFPDYNSNLKSIFDNNLGKHLTVHPDYKPYWSNYDFSVEPHDKLIILGNAMYDLEFGIGDKKVVEQKKENTQCNIEIDLPAKKTQFLNSKKNIESLNIDNSIKNYAQKYNIEADLIKAVITQESGGNPKAGSSAEAVGLMQIYSWQLCKNELNLNEQNWVDTLKDPEKNIACGTKILSIYFNQYGSKDNSNIVDKYCSNLIYNKKYKDYSGWLSALRAYNGWDCTPPGADVDYVEKITEYYEAWSEKCLLGGIDTVKTDYSYGKYFVKPSFKTKVNFTFNLFEKIKEKAVELVENCTGSASKRNCAIKKIAEYNAEESKKENGIYWSLNCDKKQSTDEHNHLFCVDSGKEINNEKVIIKFALYFP